MKKSHRNLLQCWPFVRSKSYWCKCKLYVPPIWSFPFISGGFSTMIMGGSRDRVNSISAFVSGQVWSWIPVTRSLDLFQFTMASFSRMLCNSWTWEAVILLLTCCRAWGNKMNITFSPKDEASKLPTLGFLSGCWWEMLVRMSQGGFGTCHQGLFRSSEEQQL